MRVKSELFPVGFELITFCVRGAYHTTASWEFLLQNNDKFKVLNLHVYKYPKKFDINYLITYKYFWVVFWHVQ